MNVEAAISTGVRVMGAEERPDPAAEASADDRQLVAAARADPQAFALLYRRYVHDLYRYLYHRVGNQQVAEDLTASTFGKALAGIGRYHEQGSFPAWLFSIARHTLLDYQRQLRPSVDVTAVAGALADPAASPESQLLRAEEARVLRDLVHQLPADQQEAVMLRYFGGLATADIAVLLHRREGAVRALLHRAITALREAYRREVGE